MYRVSGAIPTKRLQFDKATRTYITAPSKTLFLRGPIPLSWLGQASALPGKTMHLAVALQWLAGMSKGEPFKLSKKALGVFHVSRDAASDGLLRLEEAGLISVVRKPGQRPTIAMLEAL